MVEEKKEFFNNQTLNLFCILSRNGSKCLKKYICTPFILPQIFIEIHLNFRGQIFSWKNHFEKICRKKIQIAAKIFNLFYLMHFCFLSSHFFLFIDSMIKSTAENRNKKVTFKMHWTCILVCHRQCLSIIDNSWLS